MSSYAFDRTRSTLVASWETGLGAVAADVATLPAKTDGLHLAQSLTRLARELWRTYTHPPASVGNSTELNTEAWRRAGHREAFGEVFKAIRAPQLSKGGSIVQSYNPVEDRAHQVGRTLFKIGSAALTDVVCGELSAEMAAIDDAERGLLAGRARQAVTLSPAVPSPVQVVTADSLLWKNPLGSDALFSEVDPAAAAIAAIHWLGAAAKVAGKASGTPLVRVVAEAGNIEALPYETPTYVLQELKAGRRPREVVAKLIADALAVAEGRMPAATEELRKAIAKARRDATRMMVDPAELMPRLCLLDPRRPAVDLLEDVLLGIRGAWLLAQQHFEPDETDVDVDGDDEDEAFLQRRLEAYNSWFYSAVRAEAAATRNQLD